MTYEEWLQYGIEKEWCSPVVCDTHEGIPVNEVELGNFDDGEDPCIFAVRIWGE